MKNKITLLLLSLSSITCFASPYVSKADVELQDQYAAKETGKYVSSYNCATIENHSDQDITIQVQYNMCVDLAKCNYNHWKVKVNKQATWHDCWKPTVGQAWPEGNFQIRSETIINGINADVHGEKTGYATLHVR